MILGILVLFYSCQKRQSVDLFAALKFTFPNSGDTLIYNWIDSCGTTEISVCKVDSAILEYRIDSRVFQVSVNDTLRYVPDGFKFLSPFFGIFTDPIIEYLKTKCNAESRFIPFVISSEKMKVLVGFSKKSFPTDSINKILHAQLLEEEVNIDIRKLYFYSMDFNGDKISDTVIQIKYASYWTDIFYFISRKNGQYLVSDCISRGNRNDDPAPPFMDKTSGFLAVRAFSWGSGYSGSVLTFYKWTSDGLRNVFSFNESEFQFGMDNIGRRIETKYKFVSADTILVTYFCSMEYSPDDYLEKGLNPIKLISDFPYSVKYFRKQGRFEFIPAIAFDVASGLYPQLYVSNLDKLLKSKLDSLRIFGSAMQKEAMQNFDEWKKAQSIDHSKK